MKAEESLSHFWKTAMSNIDPSLFYNAKSSGMVIDQWCLTAKGKTLAFNVANSGMFPAVSENGFKVISELFYQEQLGLGPLHRTSMSGEAFAGAYEVSMPWKFGNDGAVLFPEEFPLWERDDEAYIEQYQDKYNITHYGEIAFNRYLKEAENLLIMWQVREAGR